MVLSQRVKGYLISLSPNKECLPISFDILILVSLYHWSALEVLLSRIQDWESRGPGLRRVVLGFPPPPLFSPGDVELFPEVLPWKACAFQYAFFSEYLLCMCINLLPIYKFTFSLSLSECICPVPCSIILKRGFKGHPKYVIKGSSLSNHSCLPTCRCECIKLKIHTHTYMIVTRVLYFLLVPWKSPVWGFSWEKGKQTFWLSLCGFKLNIQKTKIMASGPITSWEIDGETVETVSDFMFWGLQNHCRWWLQSWN